MQEISYFDKMDDFVDFEAVDNNDNYNSEDEADDDTNVNDVEFIDNSNYDENVETYYAFTNVNRRLEDAVQVSFDDFDFSQEANNY